jgi:peptide/nickel transport system substrate-binding protein
LTSDDIKYTFDRLIREPASPQKSLFEQVAQIDTPDKYTVKFTLNGPFAPFLSYVASPYTWIIARELVDSGEIKSKIVGTGPFMMDDYSQNVSITFKRNPDYFVVGQPYVDEVDWLIIPDDATRLSAFRTREFDLSARPLVSQDFETLQKAVPDIKFTDYPGTAWIHMYIRTDQPEKAFSKQKVRQAMSMALDRQAMIDVLFKGKAELEGPMTAQLVDWTIPMDQLRAGSKFYKRDLTAAKALLAEAGYPNGFAMDIWSSQGLGHPYIGYLEMAKAQLAEAGIDVTLRWQDYNTFVTQTNAGKYEDAGFGGWSPVTDPDEHLSKAYHSKGGRNQSHINDATLDEMIAKQASTTNPDERKKLMGEIQRYLAEQQYYFTLAAEPSVFAWHSQVKGYWPHILIGQAEIAEAWLDR